MRQLDLSVCLGCPYRELALLKKVSEAVEGRSKTDVPLRASGLDDEETTAYFCLHALGGAAYST